MPVPALITDLSQVAGSNFPAGTDAVTSTDDVLRAVSAFIAQLRDGKGAATVVQVASAATTDIGAANSAVVEVTGTTTITSLGTAYNGPRWVRFASSLTLTHNATTLLLPGSVNLIVGAGDWALFVPRGIPAAGWELTAFRSGVPVAPSGRNMFDNGNRQVAQQPSPPNLTTSPQIQAPDNAAYWASAGGISGGVTVAQATSVTLMAAPFNFSSPTAGAVFGAVFTGSAVFSARMRVPAIEAKKKSNKLLSFACKVHHNKGTAVNYVIVVRKPTAVDNYTSTTVITTTAAISVPSGIGTVLSFSALAVGDITAGIEVEVQAAFGATTVTFYDTDWQLEESPSPTAFEQRAYYDELRACQRYYETSNFDWTMYQSAGSGFGTNQPFIVEKFKTPTITPSAVSTVNVSTPSLIADTRRLRPAGSAFATATGAVVYTGTYTAVAHLAV